MKNPLRERGMADVAFAAYLIASKNAGIDIHSRADMRLVQGEGNATASKGFHHRDGWLDGESYTAAADFSVRGLNNTEKATWVEELTRAGWVAFYRNWDNNLHIHANYAGLPMKTALDQQNEDFFVGKDGLVGHRRIDSEWWFPEVELRKVPERLFRKSNPRGPSPGEVVPSPLIASRPKPIDLSFGLFLSDDKQPRFWMPVVQGVAYCPVRAFGTALGFDVVYDPKTKAVTYDGDDLAVAFKNIAGVAHAPVRQLASEVGLIVGSVDAPAKKVVVTRPSRK